jgi:anti-sigma regulatory factor (Ser/Thr protein kinase)
VFADRHDVPLRPGTPLIVVTSESTPEKIIAAIRAGAFAWFRKPFSASALREMADRALTAPRLPDAIEVVSATPHWLELRLRCDIETAARVLHFVRELEPELPDADRENMAMAFREILFNAVEHGGGNDPNLHINVTFIQGDAVLALRVRDPGQGFSFDRLRHAAVSHPDSPVEHALNREQMGLRPGGFGIMLTKSFVDELIYNEKGNEALLIKYLKRP